MVKWLLYIGLSVSPFLCWEGYDQRALKEGFALLICLVIALYGLGFLRFRTLQNRWLLLLVGWAFVSSLLSPRFELSGHVVEALWNYKTLFSFVAYLSALWAISNVCWSDRVIERIFSIMAFCGLLNAIVVGLQWAGIDPLFHVEPRFVRYVPAAGLTGTLGHPTFAAQFMVICLPFALYLRKWFAVLAMLVAIYLCRSNVAYAALFISFIYCYFLAGSTARVVVFALLAACAAKLFLHGGVIDSGRFNMWMTAFIDMKANARTFLTGFGPGSFGFLYPIFHNSPQTDSWSAAHNEYLEALWGMGLPGLFFMVRAAFWPIERSWHLMDSPIVWTLVCAWIALCVCAAGNFVWHLGVFCLYSLVILGILTQQIRRLSHAR